VPRKSGRLGDVAGSVIEYVIVVRGNTLYCVQKYILYLKLIAKIIKRL
jgi:hypothetical protein